MGIRYENLDAATRTLMRQESELGGHYSSPRLTPDGATQWITLLNHAIELHNDDWLADELLNRRLLRNSETYTTRTGKTASRTINARHASLQLAEGEFNRYYLRGLCQRALAEGTGHLIVYRGKDVRDPRPESEAKIGTRIRAAELLAALRSNDFVTIADVLAVPGGPNSGLTARLE